MMRLTSLSVFSYWDNVAGSTLDAAIGNFSTGA